MAQATDPFILRSALEAVTEERDIALAANEALVRDQDAQRRQLMGEQDRFVSHLIETHDREIERLKTELRTATETVMRLNAEIGLARAMLDDAMSEEITVTRPFQSLQPASGPHSIPRPNRQSGIVGRIITERPQATVNANTKAKPLRGR